jgi:hypothetical protein
MKAGDRLALEIGREFLANSDVAAIFDLWFRAFVEWKVRAVNCGACGGRLVGAAEADVRLCVEGDPEVGLMTRVLHPACADRELRDQGWRERHAGPVQ